MPYNPYSSYGYGPYGMPPQQSGYPQGYGYGGGGGSYGMSPQQQMMMQFMQMFMGGGGFGGAYSGGFPQMGGYGGGYGYPQMGYNGYGYGQSPYNPYGYGQQFQPQYQPFNPTTSGTGVPQRSPDPWQSSANAGPFGRGLADTGSNNPYLPEGFGTNGNSSWNGMESATNAGPFGRGLANTGVGASTASPSSNGNNLGQISGISYAMQTGTLQPHQDNDYESWLKAGGGGYAEFIPQWGAASNTAAQGQSSLNTLAGGASTASGTSTGSSSSGSSSETNPFGGLTNRPADW